MVWSDAEKGYPLNVFLSTLPLSLAAIHLSLFQPSIYLARALEQSLSLFTQSARPLENQAKGHFMRGCTQYKIEAISVIGCPDPSFQTKRN